MFLLITFQGSTVLAYYMEDSMMRCDEYLRFWINWKNGVIEVGKNEPYTQKLDFIKAFCM